MRSSKKTAVAIAAVAMLAAGCGGSDPKDSPTGPADYAKDGTFTFAMTGDPGSFNPYKSTQVLSEAGYLAYDSLINATPDGDYVSGLAQDWDVTEDHATFTLTEDVTCSDGHKLTATDVADDLKYLGDPDNGSVLYGFLVPAVPFTVKANDAARTVDVSLDDPFPFLLETIGQVPILCPAALRAQDKLDQESIGTGPFTLTDVVPGDHYTFTRRDDYTWGPDGATTQAAGMPKTVTIQVVPNDTTAANLLLSGDVNLAYVGGPDRDRLDEAGLDSLKPTIMSGELFFNERPGRPGSDENLRRALVTGLDLDELASVATSGIGHRATGLSANQGDPCRADTVEGRLPSFDADEAGSLLADATNGEQLSLDLHYSTEGGEEAAAAAELIADRWKKLGVDVKLSADNPNAQNTVMFGSGDFDVYWEAFNISLPYQIVSFISGDAPPDGTNFAGIDNPDYAKFSSQAMRTAGDEGCALWNKAEESLFDRLDVVPVAESIRPYYLSGVEAKDTWLQLPIPTSIRVLK